MSELDLRVLFSTGSRVTYKRFFKTGSEAEAEQLVEDFRPLIPQVRDTLTKLLKAEERLVRALMRSLPVLSLLAFADPWLYRGCQSVLYLCIGKSAMKLLRCGCLGSTGWQAFNIYLSRFFLGVIGSMGAFFGAGIQQIIPSVVQRHVAAGSAFQFPISIIQGVVLGYTFVSVLFSMFRWSGSVCSAPDGIAFRILNGWKTLKSRLAAIMLIDCSRWHLQPIKHIACAWGAMFPRIGRSARITYACGDRVVISGQKILPECCDLVAPCVGKFIQAEQSDTHAHGVDRVGAFIIATLNIVEKRVYWARLSSPAGESIEYHFVRYPAFAEKIYLNRWKTISWMWSRLCPSSPAGLAWSTEKQLMRSKGHYRPHP